MPAEVGSQARHRTGMPDRVVASRVAARSDRQFPELELLGAARWEDQLLFLPEGTKRTGRTAAAMERARLLLWSQNLTPEEFTIWSMYCDGASEAEIAKARRRSREFILDHFLGAMKALCGIPTRPYTPRTRVNARKRRRRMLR